MGSFHEMGALELQTCDLLAAGPAFVLDTGPLGRQVGRRSFKC